VNYYQRTDCRLCKSKSLKKSLVLTPSPWADDYVAKSNLSKKHELVPITLCVCADCGNGQLDHVIDPSEVYLNYTYETSSSFGLSKHFKDSALSIINKFKPNKVGLAVDIGSNDGTLLSYFKNYGMKVLGIDPMPNIAEIAKKRGIPTVTEFFTEKFSKILKKKHGFADVISANNVVANIDDLDDFFKGVRNIMNKKSIFFFETFYLPLQIKNFVWDFTYHEHLSYFRVEPLKKYFEKLGLQIIDVETNLVKGGSMRCVLQLLDGIKNVDNSVNKCIEEEKNYGFNKRELFENYSKKIESSKQNFINKIKKIISDKKEIAGYGASATSTTLMYHYNMNYLKNLYDDFTVKQNLYSPGFHIPVHASSRIYKDKPDYIVILAWRYKDQIIKKHKRFLDNGGCFIVPLPEYKIIKS